jgi:hypothetical protein
MDRWRAFVASIARDGFPPARLALAHFAQTGRGMRAERDFEAGDCLVQVPEKFLFTRSRIASIFCEQLRR